MDSVDLHVPGAAGRPEASGTESAGAPTRLSLPSTRLPFTAWADPQLEQTSGTVIGRLMLWVPKDRDTSCPVWRVARSRVRNFPVECRS